MLIKDDIRRKSPIIEEYCAENIRVDNGSKGYNFAIREMERMLGDVCEFSEPSTVSSEGGTRERPYYDKPSSVIMYSDAGYNSSEVKLIIWGRYTIKDDNRSFSGKAELNFEYRDSIVEKDLDVIRDVIRNIGFVGGRLLEE